MIPSIFPPSRTADKSYEYLYIDGYYTDGNPEIPALPNDEWWSETAGNWRPMDGHKTIPWGYLIRRKKTVGFDHFI